MEFCPRCGAILMQKRKNDGCPRCSYIKKGKLKIVASEKINERKEIPIITNKETSIHPIVKETCKKCKNKEAYFWALQTRSSDEAETKFFKCTKCEYTWRDYR